MNVYALVVLSSAGLLKIIIHPGLLSAFEMKNVVESFVQFKDLLHQVLNLQEVLQRVQGITLQHFRYMICHPFILIYQMWQYWDTTIPSSHSTWCSSLTLTPIPARLLSTRQSNAIKYAIHMVAPILPGEMLS